MDEPQEQQQPEPTYEEWCANHGHPFAGQDRIDGIRVARCYCGAWIWPLEAPDA